MSHATNCLQTQVNTNAFNKKFKRFYRAGSKSLRNNKGHPFLTEQIASKPQVETRAFPNLKTKLIQINHKAK